MNWILYGFKSAGKSHFAKKLSLPHICTDSLIEERAEMPIREFVEKEGETAFRTLERKVIEELEPNGHLISVGGGAVLDQHNLEKLQSLGPLLYLNCPKEILKKRLLADPPTYFDPDDSEGSFERIYSQRIPIYEKIATYTVPVQGEKETIGALWLAIRQATSSKSLHGGNPTAKRSEL